MENTEWDGLERRTPYKGAPRMLLRERRGQDKIVSRAVERVSDREEDGKVNPITQHPVSDFSVQGRPLSAYAGYEVQPAQAFTASPTRARANGEFRRNQRDKYSIPAPAVVTISPDGSVSGLKRDEFNLGFLGHQEVARASTIDWMENVQSFGINLKGKYAITGEPPYRMPLDSLTFQEAIGFDSYEEARETEVAWIEYCHEEGIQPLSAAGLAFVRGYRGMP